MKGLNGCRTNINFKKPYPLAKGNSTYDHKSRELLTRLDIWPLSKRSLLILTWRQVKV